MTLRSTVLAAGAGWQASEVRCAAGPADAAYQEQHDRICMAIVLEGTFAYRSSRGTATLVPGAVLLGNPGDCFECGHEHSIGDRCLSFHLDPAFYEDVLAGVPGTTRLTLERPALAPRGGRDPLVAWADAALNDPAAMEELACDLAARAAGAPPLQDGSPCRARAGRIEELVHWIETDAQQPLSLAGLARRAGMSPYHLLREFRRVTGVTPHQFVIALRLRRAAALLRHSRETVLSVALEAGFSDLSEFNRRFRRALGMTPTAYRARHGRR
jgi:AraC-like DNA-binding protein